MINTKLFFQLAKEKGINESEITYSNSTSFAVETLNGEIDSNNYSESKSITARGIVNGQFGSARTNIENKDTVNYLINSIVASGNNVESIDEAIIFPGSKKYVKYSGVFNKELASIPVSVKLAHLDTIYKFAKEFDSRIENINVSFEEYSSNTYFENSYGLKLKEKSNHYAYGLFVTVRAENGEVVNASDVFAEGDFSKFDAIKFAEEVCKEAISKLNPITCKSKKYKVVLKNSIVSSLISRLVSNFAADEIQKNSSIYVGKLDTQIVSKKLTVEERPLDKNFFFTNFDSEHVATTNKVLIKNGVLKTYLYNLSTARKDNRESTGNGYGSVNKISIGFTHLVIKKGKKSLEQLFEKAKNGIYITQIMGMHAGMDPKSGNFSLQAQGYMIEDGKITKPLSQIVVAGNLFEMFNNVLEVGSDSKLLLSSHEVPSILFKNIQVNGK